MIRQFHLISVLRHALGIALTVSCPFLFVGCSGQQQAEQSFEELFKLKQERVASYLQEEDFELAGLKATREMHNSGGRLTGTIEFRANARDGSVLSAVYHFSWKGGQWGLTSSQPARLTRKGSSKELKKIDRIMESSE